MNVLQKTMIATEMRLVQIPMVVTPVYAMQSSLGMDIIAQVRKCL